MRTINAVLLIDDNASTNFLHSRVLRNSRLVDHIHSVTSAREGLAYLSAPHGNEYFRPDLIFLDINMPGMNGWEFVEAYRSLPTDERGENVIVMLTTSLNPDDLKRAREIEEIKEYYYKPLTVQKITDLVEKHFSKV